MKKLFEMLLTFLSIITKTKGRESLVSYVKSVPVERFSFSKTDKHSITSNLSQVNMSGNGNIVINGKSYSGKNLTIKNNKVFIDGVEQESSSIQLNITINGDVNSMDITGDTVVNGNVTKINVGVGDVKCNDVAGDVIVDVGDVNVSGNISGKVKVSVGDIKYRK